MDGGDALTAPAVAAASGPPLLRPLRVRDFRLLFAGESISVLGDHFHFVALAGAIVDLGAVTAMFAVAGAIVAGAALVGFASGVAGRMTYAADEGPRSVL